MDNWHEGQGDCVPARVGHAPVRGGYAQNHGGNMSSRVDNTPARVGNAPARRGYAQNRRDNARWKRIKYKAWGNAPGTHPSNYFRATGATQRKQSTMSLLGRPRRSLFSIKVTANIIAASTSMVENVFVWAMGIMDVILAE